MKNFIKALAMNFAASAVGMMGIFAGMTIWGAGLGDRVEEKAQKVFQKKEEA